MEASLVILATALFVALGHPCAAAAREGFAAGVLDGDLAPAPLRTPPGAAAPRGDAAAGCPGEGKEGVVASPPRIPINRASAEDLQRLPGIGPRKAQALVDARTQRPFRRPSDLRRVKGFGARTVQRLAPSLDFD